MIVRITVTLQVDVDLQAWATDYCTATAVESLSQALADLREAGHYLASSKWRGLADVASVSAVVDLAKQPARRPD